MVAQPLTQPALILVTGATGNQGGAVARRLLADGAFRVRALVREPQAEKARALAAQGAALVQGNLEDRLSVERALDGVDGVFAVLRFFETDQAEETAQGVALADAAQAAGVGHFVYSSAASAHRHTGVPHIESKWKIECHIRQIGLPHTILRPVAFNYSLEAYRDGVMQGRLVDPFSPDTKIFQISEENYANFVVLALANPQQWLGRALDVASDVSTARQMAELFGRVTGKQVQYVQISFDEARQAVGDEVTNLMRWIENVGPDIDVAALRREFPWLTSLEDYLRSHGWQSTER
ncbi:MAG: NmrA/HSCARG family protein [Aphanocapsa lilacina HA4352-LM1]|nr:NmrA/HSCARG family protein [Aphanocapsa lilacina HA4352-LM1]